MIIFQNPGVISRKSITAFGVSSKEKAGAIGYFGTGLKYAIAILLRHGQKVTVFAGTDKLTFGTKKSRVRVDDFEFVTMNGRTLDFTTEVGKNWELWAAFRELWCNCMDEGGAASRSFSIADIGDPAGKTTVVVEGDAFDRLWDSRANIVLQTQPIAKTDALWVHPGESHHIYYRGVRVMELSAPSLYTYNIQETTTLTEDRTLMYPWMAGYSVKQGIEAMDNREVILKVVTADRDRFEHSLSFDGTPGPDFLAVVEPLAMSFDSQVNQSAVACCRTKLNQRMKAQQKELPPLDARRLDKAVAFCKALGYKVDEFPIVVSEFIGKEVLGAAEDGTIFISQRALMQGTKVVAGTLLEEWIHLKHKYTDESRGMQNWLLDALVSLGEQLTGEPL